MIVFLSAVQIRRAVELSVFPTLLLLLTLFRLSLNIASSRRILLHGSEGTAAAGSVIQAQGSYPAAKDVPITIGAVAGSDGTGAVSGDGALVRVSNGADAVVTRLDTTDASTNAG